MIHDTSMISDSRRIILFVIVGLLFVSNSIWLVPHEGDVQYTYERAQIDVENGILTYDGKDINPAENDLIAIGCQFQDRGESDDRACGFDAYLSSHGPVSVPNHGLNSHSGSEFIRLGDAYYQQVRDENSSTVTYDVNRVSPQTLLSRVRARNISDAPRELEEFSLHYRIAVTGDTTTSFEKLEDDDLGRLYHQNGVYYTVVLTDETVHDIALLPPVRSVLLVAGLILLAAATVESTGRIEWTGT